MRRTGPFGRVEREAEGAWRSSTSGTVSAADNSFAFADIPAPHDVSLEEGIAPPAGLRHRGGFFRLSRGRAYRNYLFNKKCIQWPVTGNTVKCASKSRSGDSLTHAVCVVLTRKTRSQQPEVVRALCLQVFSKLPQKKITCFLCLCVCVLSSFWTLKRQKRPYDLRCASKFQMD